MNWSALIPKFIDVTKKLLDFLLYLRAIGVIPQGKNSIPDIEIVKNFLSGKKVS